MSTNAVLATPAAEAAPIAASVPKPPKPTFMDVVVHRDTLLAEISVAQGITSSKTTIPILSTFLLEANDGSLSITASNLDQTLRTNAAAIVKTTGAATVPARKFLDYIKLLSGGDIRIKLLENSWVQIQAGRSKTRMIGMERDNFPQVPSPAKLKPVSIPVSVLGLLIAHTILAVSKEGSRYTLNAALLVLESKTISMVATDGNRLAIAEQDLNLAGVPSVRKLLIPAKALHDLVSLAASTNVETVELFEDETTMFFRFSYREYSTRKTIGSFPDYLRVIPANNQLSLVVRTADFERSVRRVAQFADNTSNAVKLSVASNSLKIASSAADVGESEDTIDVPYTGAPFSIRLNSGYLLDFSKAIGGAGEVKMSFKDGSSAARLTPIDENRTIRFAYIVMPMRA